MTQIGVSQRSTVLARAIYGRLVACLLLGLSFCLAGKVAQAQVLTVDDNWVKANGTTVTGSYSNIKVYTTIPITITGCSLNGQGNLIQTYGHNNLTVTNSYGAGPGSTSTGCFIYAYQPTRLDVEHNSMTNTGFGIWVVGYGGDGTSSNSVTVRYNSCRNITGQAIKSSGQGLPHWLQLTSMGTVSGIDIGWNQVINDPYISSVEDVINVGSTNGTPSSPINIHDNYIQGAYPNNPVTDSYTGGGILIADGPVNWSTAHDNQVINTDGYGVANNGGSNDAFWNNTIVGSGILPDGNKIGDANVGAYIVGGGTNNWASDYGSGGNTIGFSLQPQTPFNPNPSAMRNDIYFPDNGSEFAKQTYWAPKQYPSTAPTRQDEVNQYQVWLTKMLNNGVTVGPSVMPNGTYEITAKTTGFALDCYGAQNTDGTIIQIYPWKGSNNQKWSVKKLGNGYYSVNTINPDGTVGRSLDCTGCSGANGTQIELWDAWGGSCQQWALTGTVGSYYKIATANGGDVLDGGGCSGSSGTKVILWSWDGPGNTCQQEWEFTPVTP